MAIFQRAYQGYHGELSSPLQRPMVICRYALADLFSSRLFVAFFAICFIPPLAIMCILYMRYNLQMLTQLEIPLDDLMKIDAAFFASWVQIPQMFLVFVLIMFIGPALVSPDLRNNALPLYLSRPISKTSYVVGKLLVLLILGSLITWIPSLLLILFRAYLGEAGWLMGNLHIPMAALVASLTWICTLSMMSLAISAWVKWKAVARLFFFGLVFVGSALGTAISEIFGGWSGSVVSLFDAMQVMVMSLYGGQTWPNFDMPGWVAATVFVTITALSVILLGRRIRAFEVVS